MRVVKLQPPREVFVDLLKEELPFELRAEIASVVAEDVRTEKITTSEGTRTLEADVTVVLSVDEYDPDDAQFLAKLRSLHIRRSDE
jgi:hypothetical protein